MSSTDAYTDVVELCALLQCLGFSVKSLDTSDGNISHDGASRTVVINCQEFGCSLLCSLPKTHRDRLSKELHEIIKCIRQHNESDAETQKDMPKETSNNKSASMIELKTPDKLDFKLKADTPTRYRSLDTLIAPNKMVDQPIPTPGALQRPNLNDGAADDAKNINKQIMCSRQSTYTLSSTPGSVRRRNKTSSPIKYSQNSMLESLKAAEKTAEDLRSKLALMVREFDEDERQDSSISSLALDVSKISVLKGTESSKAQFASSPNLSAIGHVKEDLAKTRLRRFESASTSNLAPIKFSGKESSLSKLRRMSPNFFRMKDSASSKPEKAKTPDGRSKLNSLIKPKIVTPIRTPRMNTESSPNLSASSRNKYSHVKSTIPRPSKKE